MAGGGGVGREGPTVSEVAVGAAEGAAALSESLRSSPRL